MEARELAIQERVGGIHNRCVPEFFVSGLASPRKIFPEQRVHYEKFIRGLVTSYKISHCIRNDAIFVFIVGER